MFEPMYSVTECSASQKQPCPNVILYLPPGPILQTGRKSRKSISHVRDSHGRETRPDPFHIQHHLASTTSSTVVTVHYRLGTVNNDQPPQPNEMDEAADSEPEPEPNTIVESTSSFRHYKFPVPIHDTLAVFDWVQETFQPTQLSILGTHIGGSMALALALTEAQSVHSVAVVEPICDWTALDGYCMVEEEEDVEVDNQRGGMLNSDFDEGGHVEQTGYGDHDVLEESGVPKPLLKGKRPPTPAPPDLLTLLEARRTYFAKPEKYFDPFASPLLFLRSPGKGVPLKSPQYRTGPDYPVPILKRGTSGDALLDLWDGVEIPPGVIEINGEYIQTETKSAASGDATKVYVPRYRKALTRWPPFGLDHGLTGARWLGPHRRLKRLQMTLPWLKFYIREDLNPNPNGKANKQNLPTPPSSPELKPRRRQKKPRGSTILAQQSDEMVDIMRRACFWGRARDQSEKGVVLSRVVSPTSGGRSGGDGNDGWTTLAEEEAGRWLWEVHNEER